MLSALAKLSKYLRAVGATARLLFFAVLPSLPVIAYIERDNPQVAIGCFLACALAGLILDSWPVTGTLLGVACGFIFQPVFWSGTIESQAWNSLGVHVFWTVLGLGAGFTIDAAKRSDPRRPAKRAVESSAEFLPQQHEPPTSG